MSASEKLKALGDEMTQGVLVRDGQPVNDPELWGALIRYWMVLPLLHDVVEAAEKGMLGREPELDAALTALDEALE